MAAMHQYTIDQGLEAVGFGRFQWLLLLLSGIGFFATTVELISLALLAEPLLKYWPQLSSHQLAYLASSTFAGELVGGLAWGSVSDLLGRRWVFLGTAMGAAVTGVLGAMAPCFYSLALTRFLLGISIGGCLSIDFVYFVEFVPVQSRGFRSTFIILLGILAFFYTSLIGWLVFHTSLVKGIELPRWRLFVFGCAVPYVLLFLGRIAWPWESPRFLLTRGKTHQAKQVLQAMARWNGTRLPLGELQPLSALSSSSCSSSPEPTSASLEKGADRDQRTQPQPQSLLVTTVIISCLFFCQTFSFYGLTLWLRNFPKAHGIKTLTSIHTFLVIGLSELPGLALTTLLLDRIGRRPLLILTFTGSAVCSIMLPLAHTAARFLAFLSASYFFIVGSWAALYLVTPELVPTRWRTRVFGVAGAAGKTAGMISPHIFGALWAKNVSLNYIVAILASGFIGAALISAFLLVETRNSRLLDH